MQNLPINKTNSFTKMHLWNAQLLVFKISTKHCLEDSRELKIVKAIIEQRGIPLLLLCNVVEQYPLSSWRKRNTKPYHTAMAIYLSSYQQKLQYIVRIIFIPYTIEQKFTTKVIFSASAGTQRTQNESYTSKA